MTSNSNFLSESERYAYAAGFIDARGSFTVAISQARTRTKYIKLAIKSSAHSNGVHKLAEMLELNANETRSGTSLFLSGEPLHNLMRNLWPYLARDRKLEYQRLRLMIKPESADGAADQDRVFTGKGQGYDG